MILQGKKAKVTYCKEGTCKKPTAAKIRQGDENVKSVRRADVIIGSAQKAVAGSVKKGKTQKGGKAAVEVRAEVLRKHCSVVPEDITIEQLFAGKS